MSTLSRTYWTGGLLWLLCATLLTGCPPEQGKVFRGAAPIDFYANSEGDFVLFAQGRVEANRPYTSESADTIIRIDEELNPFWSQAYVHKYGENSFFNHIAPAPLGGFMMVTSKRLLSLDSLGNTLWEHSFEEWTCGMKTDVYGHAYVLLDNAYEPFDIFIRKYDENGEPLWDLPCVQLDEWAVFSDGTMLLIDANNIITLYNTDSTVMGSYDIAVSGYLEQYDLAGTIALQTPDGADIIVIAGLVGKEACSRPSRVVVFRFDPQLNVKGIREYPHFHPGNLLVDGWFQLTAAMGPDGSILLASPGLISPNIAVNVVSVLLTGPQWPMMKLGPNGRVEWQKILSLGTGQMSTLLEVVISPRGRTMLFLRNSDMVDLIVYKQSSTCLIELNADGEIIHAP